MKQSLKLITTQSIALTFVVVLSARAGSPGAVVTVLDSPPELKPTLDSYLLKLHELEELQVPAKKYRIKQRELVANFIAERTKAYQSRNLNETVTCAARAPRPGPFHGRNTDTCAVTLPSASYKGKWLYDSHTNSEKSRLSGGSAAYKVHPAAGKDSVTMNVTCRSPAFDDTTSAHCGLKMSISANFKMSENEIADTVNAEALQLMK